MNIRIYSKYMGNVSYTQTFGNHSTTISGSNSVIITTNEVHIENPGKRILVRDNSLDVHFKKNNTSINHGQGKTQFEGDIVKQIKQGSHKIMVGDDRMVQCSVIKQFSHDNPKLEDLFDNICN